MPEAEARTILNISKKATEEEVLAVSEQLQLIHVYSTRARSMHDARGRKAHQRPPARGDPAGDRSNARPLRARAAPSARSAETPDTSVRGL